MIRFLIILLFLSFNFTFAKDLQGRITYSEQSARIEAFKDLARKIPKEMFSDYLKDKYYKENYKNIKNKNFYIENEPKRNLYPFYVLNTLIVYCVEYENDINKKYYYNALGRLVKFEINDYSGHYPYRAIAYDKNGNVINIVFVPSETESFVFDRNEKLLGHWLDNDFYNQKDKKRYSRISY